MPFIGRVSELSFLNELYGSDRPELYILYGRRRVGKTELLREFCQGKRHVYFQAAQVSEDDNRRHLAAAIAEGLQEPLLAMARFDDWETPLQELSRRARDDRLVVVLDEFPYLCDSAPGLPSLLQRFWDHNARESRLLLALCGSAISFMENEVLAERSPLFGRRTGQQELLPFGFREAAQFVPRYGSEDRLRVFGILGGMPMYLTQFNDRVSLAQNVQAHILRPQALLHEEPTNLLRGELRDPGTYHSILNAIASGLTRSTEIAQRVGIAVTALGRYLPALQELRLVRRVVSAGDRAPEKRARGRYFLDDHFLRFWYRFVLPNRSLLEVGEGRRVWDERIAPQLDEYLGRVFEGVCAQYVRNHARERLPALPIGRVGPFWHKEAEIDLVWHNDDGSTSCAECKWTRAQMGERELRDLQENAVALPAEWQRDLRYVLFSRAGFTEDLRRQEDGNRLVLVGLEDIGGEER
jgi:hypothetical protein